MTKHTQVEAKSKLALMLAMQPAHSGLLAQQKQEDQDRSLLPSEDRLRSPDSPNPIPINPSLVGHSFGSMAIGTTTSPVLQRKLAIGQPGDRYEQEANQVADQVMRMPAPEQELQRQSKNPEEDEQKKKRLQMQPLQRSVESSVAEEEEKKKKRLQMKPISEAGSEVSPDLQERISGLQQGGGQPLSTSERAFFEPRFGQDFSQVRLHTDAPTADLAQAVNARAFTVGRDVVFGTGQYQPRSSEGKRLLAHELTHVVQQTRKPELLQKQEATQENTSQEEKIPNELKTSVDLKLLSEEQLQQRYDLISSTLMFLQQSSPEIASLKAEAGRIGIELARRKALRTFTGEAIEKMKSYFIANATSANPKSCIATLNDGVRLLLNQPSQPVGGEIQVTMARLQKTGRAGQAQTIEFNAKNGSLTSGTLRPEQLRESVWDKIINLTGGDSGWSVFGLSLMDGYHSVTLSLDNTIPSSPHLYWSDQWSSRGGWQELDRGGLDAEITKLTQSWWDKWGTNEDEHKEKHQGTKPRTRVTLWRLQQSNP